jgi:biotin operon repressor
MKAIGEILKEKNLQLDTVNPVLQNGFTQVPNFILKDPNISVGAKVAYAMFLSYAWHNDSCFPGQDRLAEDMGLTRVRVTQLISELEDAGLVTIQRRGQGKTNLYTIHFQVKPAVDKTPEVNRFTSRSKPADIWR